MQVLKFSATWCGPCKAMSKQLEGINTSVAVKEIDIDSNIDLVKQYGIRGVPALVLVKDDKEVSRLQGSQKIEALQDWFNKASAM